MMSGGASVKRPWLKPGVDPLALLRKSAAVFCYGTLLLPRYQRRLFGRTVTASPAVLRGWRLRMGYDGYRFIQPSPHQSVCGSLLWLTPAQLNAADCWEDVPYYQRESVCLRSRNKAIQAWVYTRRQGQGRSCPAQRFTTHTSARLVLRTYRHFFQV